MAERQGFEPWEGINPQRFSRPPLSTTQPPLRLAEYTNSSVSGLKAIYRLFNLIGPNRILIYPFYTQPIPDAHGEHHCRPTPVIDKKDFCNPLHINKIAPGNAIKAKYQTTPKQYQCHFTRFYTRKGKKHPYWCIFFFLHSSLLPIFNVNKIMSI